MNKVFRILLVGFLLPVLASSDGALAKNWNQNKKSVSGLLDKLKNIKLKKPSFASGLKMPKASAGGANNLKSKLDNFFKSKSNNSPRNSNNLQISRKISNFPNKFLDYPGKILDFSEMF